MSLATPLSTIIQKVERSFFHAIRKQAVAKGYLPDIYTFLPDSDSNTVLYNNAITAIKVVKGFAIEVFNTSNPQAKGIKKIPRIVLIPGSRLPGDLGGSPDRRYFITGDTYSAKIQPPQTVNFQFEVSLLSNTTQQSRILNSLVALALPKRGYIEFYDDPTNLLFIRQYTYRDYPITIEGIMEETYYYEAMDIFDTEDEVVKTNISKIEEIKVEKILGTPTNENPQTDGEIIIPSLL